MNITSEHIAAITIPAAVAIVGIAICGAAVKGCSMGVDMHKAKLAAGMVQVYDPVGNGWVWRPVTNMATTITIERQK